MPAAAHKGRTKWCRVVSCLFTPRRPDSDVLPPKPRSSSKQSKKKVVLPIYATSTGLRPGAAAKRSKTHVLPANLRHVDRTRVFYHPSPGAAAKRSKTGVLPIYATSTGLGCFTTRAQEQQQKELGWLASSQFAPRRPDSGVLQPKPRSSSKKSRTSLLPIYATSTRLGCFTTQAQEQQQKEQDLV